MHKQCLFFQYSNGADVVLIIDLSISYKKNISKFMSDFSSAFQKKEELGTSNLT